MKWRRFAYFIAEDNGQSLVESSLIYFLIIIAIIVSLTFFGVSLQSSFANSAEKISDALK